MYMFKHITPGEAGSTLLALAAASVSPLAFTWSATGAITMHRLGIIAIAPAALLWLAILALAALMGWKRLAWSGGIALAAGVLGTMAMEVVRVIGFREFQAMPGSLPMLIGVQLTDRFMDGPNLMSNLIGWADHAWNGIGFAFIYITLFGRMRWWVGTIYALGIATIFMLSPVMDIIGAGTFGQDFAPVLFPVTVYLAHIAYGSTVGWVVQRSPRTPRDLLHDMFGAENRVLRYLSI
ncbi:hypothetical protein [Oleiagrimonas sp.]|jgi:hypothetical protein|uniref:hypothetical protein n=1 Tax=Oleiagrimonas sp. TaxID=2010330 RepID=UPI0026295DBF|nr:hypothetical protein [Oleiagrimonas sp.]MDA3914063.1 hypothetical protein [Oleiagrimonas sp.]